MTMTTAQSVKRYTVKMNDRIIGHGELRKVAVHVIKVDSAYQRDVSRTWIAQHMPFEEKRAGTIVLSGRAGGPYCIDGGHRLELARESGVSHVNAFMIDGLAQVDEAKLFTQYQRERRNLTSHALYRADLVAQDPETMDMSRVVNNAGFRLAKTTGTDNITAIDAIRSIHRMGGDDLLSRTLRCVRALWIGEEKALSGQVLKGLALFLRSAGDDPSFDNGNFERVLHRVSPMKLLRLSQAVAEKRAAVSSSASNVAEALHQEYNKTANPPLGPLTIGGKKRARPR